MSDQKPAVVNYELTQEREIVLLDRGRQYRLVCRRITELDWTRYFQGISITSEQDGRERINMIDVNSPRLALAEAVLIDAKGYTVSDGRGITDLPAWQRRIPLAHRLRLGEVLADVRPSSADEELVIAAEGEVIKLDAAFTAGADGNMVRLCGLGHSFCTPTDAQFRRYSRESSRSRVVGGSRSGKTIYQGAQLLLADLYNELVISVDGYTAYGAPLETYDVICREMDMLHKVIAVQELFQPQEISELAMVAEDAAEGAGE